MPIITDFGGQFNITNGRGAASKTDTLHPLLQVFSIYKGSHNSAAQLSDSGVDKPVGLCYNLFLLTTGYQIYIYM